MPIRSDERAPTFVRKVSVACLDDLSSSHLNRRSFFLIAASLLAGLLFCSLTPNSLADIPFPVPLLLATSGLWLIVGSLLHVGCVLLGGKGKYVGSVAATFRVHSVLYALSHLVALCFGLLAQTSWFFGKLGVFGETGSLLGAMPTALGIVTHTSAMVVFLPLVLRRVHFLSWSRSVPVFLFCPVLIVVRVAATTCAQGAPAFEDGHTDFIAFSRIGQAWNCGYRGENARIAICDSHFDMHSAASRKYVDFASMVPGEPAGEISPWHGEWMANLAIETAPKAKIIPIWAHKYDTPSFVPCLLQGIRYAADHGAVAITSSLGSFRYSRDFREAIEYAERKGSVFITCHPVKAKKSREAQETLGKIISTGLVSVPDHRVFPADNRDIYVWPYSIEPAYGDGWGYSNGPPIVAGVIALIKSANPDLKPQELKEIIVSTASTRLGFRVLDAEAAVKEALRRKSRVPGSRDAGK